LKLIHYYGQHISISELIDHDVVLTSYDFIMKEIHAARPGRESLLRNPHKYKRRVSLLVKILWWRVVLDEAQMVESSLSKTAEMALLLPRINAWAVTGTPSRSGDIEETCGLFRFLKVEPFSSGSNFWKKFKALSLEKQCSLISIYMHRNLKKTVENELLLHKQSEKTIFLKFTAVEAQYYADQETQALKEIGEEPDYPSESDSKSLKKYDMQISSRLSKMRAWLLKLRQVACHPQIMSGDSFLGEDIQTMDKVLDTMIDRAYSNILSLESQLVGNVIEICAIKEYIS
jgi:E3 ubiquitin-protein ligase SHPRH